ncbi:MAG: hypothetical protein NC489_30790 [Ruminococcus flavefaciens]|nr:hypothetical protein [Ruminococcus flavefaciens]
MGMCLRFPAEVLLANLFAQSEYPAGYTPEEVREYFAYLAGKFPEYLVTDLSEQSIYDCAEEYPELYRWRSDGQGGFSVRSGEYRPNVAYFMDGRYSEGVQKYMGQVTADYIGERRMAADMEARGRADGPEEER